MTRAERAMDLHAKLYAANRLKKIGGRIGAKLGTSYESAADWPGAHQLGEMRLELTELKRQMGGSERRQFERLLAEWREVPQVFNGKAYHDGRRVNGGKPRRTP